jgi:hypothetical protein
MNAFPMARLAINSDIIAVYVMLRMPIPPGKDHLVKVLIGVMAGGALIDHYSCLLSYY